MIIPAGLYSKREYASSLNYLFSEQKSNGFYYSLLIKGGFYDKKCWDDEHTEDDIRRLAPFDFLILWALSLGLTIFAIIIKIINYITEKAYNLHNKISKRLSINFIKEKIPNDKTQHLIKNI